MSIKLRKYNREDDYLKVYHLLLKTYNPGNIFYNWLPVRWEYMHFHPILDETHLNKIGVWEDNGRIVGVVNYESYLGEAFFQVDQDYDYLKSDMLVYAEENLCKLTEDKSKSLCIWINEHDREFKKIAKLNGFKEMEDTDMQSVFVIPAPFPVITVPNDFKLIGLNEDNNIKKENKVLYRGFNNGEVAPEDDKTLNGRRKMRSAPNWKPELNIITVAPDGDYASYCGMWYLPEKKTAIVEPVATDPKYRRMGLGKAVVLEGIRRCAERGAKVAIVGSQQQFYLNIGFNKWFAFKQWKKTTKPLINTDFH